MTTYIIPILSLLLVGCSSELNRAQQDVACASHGEVYSYAPLYPDPVCCTDATTIPNNVWSSIKGPEVAEALRQRKSNVQ